MILTGDFNIDVLPDSNSKDNLYERMEDYGLRQLINRPTRNKNVNTCIDLIFTNIIHVLSSGILLVNSSDHLPVYVSIKHKQSKVEKKEFVGRSYKNVDDQIFGDELRQVDWSSFDQCEDVEECWEIYCNIHSVLDRHCPIRNFKVGYKEEA